MSPRREGKTRCLAMLVPGLAATIATAGTSHGALLDYAWSGHGGGGDALSDEHHRCQLLPDRHCGRIATVGPPGLDDRH